MLFRSESESLHEMNRFIKAMVNIHNEIQKVISGKWDKDNNPLKNAPTQHLKWLENGTILIQEKTHCTQ